MLQRCNELKPTDMANTTSTKVMSFTETYNAYHKDILYFINYKVRDMKISEEITNDVFLKASAYKHDSEKANMRTWLRKIAITCVSDYYRVDHSNIFTNVSDFQDENGNETLVISDSVKTDSLIENNEFKVMVEKAFSTLKPKYKRIATLFFLEELSHAEIVELTELPLNTVKVMIGRCREMLQSELSTAKVNYLYQ